MAETLLYDVGVLIVGLTLISIAGSRLGIPHILSYILTGIVLGGSVLGLIENHTFIQLLSDLGVVFLLFLVGLRIDIDEFNGLESVTLLVSTLQILASAITGLIISFFLQLPLIESLYFATAVVFSSTVVGVKILEERNDIAKLYGRINIAILLVQDILVILVLTAVSSISSGAQALDHATISIIQSFSVGILLILASMAAARWVLPPVFRTFAESPESILVASIGWCMSLIAISGQVSLTPEIGSFLAGISLGQLPYKEELKEKVSSLTYVFIALFFASLGLRVDVLGSVDLLVPALIISVGIMAVKFVTVYGGLRWRGFPDQTGFMSGIGLAQISEFSFVLIALGASLGHVSSRVLSLTVLVGILSIGLSSILMQNSGRLYSLLRSSSSRAGQFDRREEEKEEHIILVGCHVQGQDLASNLQDAGEDVLIIDHDPDIIEKLLNDGYHAIYGDIGDLQPRKDMDLPNAKLLISTIPTLDENKLLVSRAREHDVPVIVKARSIENALELYDRGADYVIFPDMLSAMNVAEIVDDVLQDGQTLEAIGDPHREKLKHEKLENSLWEEVFSK